jgi:acyl-coenzyme A thioesterase PaaI-like protein
VRGRRPGQRDDPGADLRPEDAGAGDGDPNDLDASWGNGAGADYPPGYPELIAQFRVLQDTIAGTAPPAELVAPVTAALADVCARLAPYATGERHQLFGRLNGMPGRGQAMTPVFVPGPSDDKSIAGHVTFGRFYLGGNGAVHGGAMPLLFDEVLGRLANSGGRSRSRTAYLRVDYRNVAPVGAELAVSAWLESEEGRKRLVRATLRHGDTLCAEAEALFVALRPGQP